MKIKMGEIQNAKPVLEKLIKFELPFATVRALGKIVRTISDELVLVNEKRVELVKKHGAEDETTKAFNVKKESLEDFYKDFSDVLNTEVELDITPISAKLLEHPNVLLSTTDFYLIEKLIQQ